MHKIIEDLNWRYAVKKYDASKKLNDEQLSIIKESLRLVPTSYGLQPLKYLIIEDPVIRGKLKVASYGQSQVTDASHLIVLCSFLDIQDEYVDSYMEKIIQIRDADSDSTAKFGAYIKQTVSKLSPKEKEEWNSKQAYIALGQLMHTCASLRIDATPMEGFDPLAYNDILGLESKNLKATILCAIGYRSEEDVAQYRKKVRRRQQELFETI